MLKESLGLPYEEVDKDAKWQVQQSLYAIGTGGLFGKGIGNSVQKYLWLSLGETDFIFAIIAEELGLLERVRESGWKSLSAKETGRIGGLMTKRRREQEKAKEK